MTSRFGAFSQNRLPSSLSPQRKFKERKPTAMLNRIPDVQDMTDLLGEELCAVWTALCRAIEEKYDMDQIWDKGYREWTYEYKYRRGGKTLCTLYAKENAIGFQVIFGKDERAKFEPQRAAYPEAIQADYDAATVYHDGKWVMFLPSDTSLTDDYVRLLAVKRRPNRK